MFEVLEQKIRERAKIVMLPKEQKDKIFKYFISWLDTKFISEKTKNYYVSDALEMLNVSDVDTIVSFCVYSQNSRTVLKYLDEIREALEKEGELNGSQ